MLISAYPVSFDWVVDLGYMTFGVRTNLPYLPGGDLVYHRAATSQEFNACAYRVNLHQAGDLDDSEVTWLAQNRTDSFRAKRFETGFYVTHHFGVPAYLFSYGAEWWVVGTDLSKLLWSYFTKVILTIEAERTHGLHLKAASIEIDGQGVLLVGRGSAGKTALAKHICERGAHFVCNTHCIIDQTGWVTGVRSPLRVRRDEVFAERIDTLAPRSHMDPREFAFSSDDLFGICKDRTKISKIFIVDFQSKSKSIIKKISALHTLNFMRTFSLPIPTYGIKDDVLSWLGGDHGDLFEVLSSIDAKLASLVETTDSFYVSMDLSRQENWEALLEVTFEQAIIS